MDRISAIEARLEIPEILTPLAYANVVQVTSGTHELTFDFFQALPGKATDDGTQMRAPVTHVVRIAIPFTLVKDLRRILDAQISTVEDRLGIIPVASEVGRKYRQKVQADLERKVKRTAKPKAVKRAKSTEV